MTAHTSPAWATILEGEFSPTGLATISLNVTFSPGMGLGVHAVPKPPQ